MVTVKCLFCDADNDPSATGGYCEACGKKLPPASAYRSKRSLAGMGDTTTDEPVIAKRRWTAEALLSVTVLQLVGGGLFLVLGPLVVPRAGDRFLSSVVLLTVVPAVAFAVLCVAARAWPRPAAITALALYAVWAVVSLVVVGELAWYWSVLHVLVLGLLVWPLVASQQEDGPRVKMGR